jgi:hypothetical protein
MIFSTVWLPSGAVGRGKWLTNRQKGKRTCKLLSPRRKWEFWKSSVNLLFFCIQLYYLWSISVLWDSPFKYCRCMSENWERIDQHKHSIPCRRWSWSLNFAKCDFFRAMPSRTYGCSMILSKTAIEQWRFRTSSSTCNHVSSCVGWDLGWHSPAGWPVRRNFQRN